MEALDHQNPPHSLKAGLEVKMVTVGLGISSSLLGCAPWE